MVYCYKNGVGAKYTFITQGPNPYRFNGTKEDITKFNASMTNPPPDRNPEWYVGSGGQWRKEPVRKIEMFREVSHGVLGLVVGLAGLFALFTSVPVSLPIAFWALMMLGFFTYEITEGWRIYDWAYRDIGGYMVGWGVGAVASILALGIWG